MIRSLDWVAGFFEGEGSVSAVKASKKTAHTHIRMQFVMWNADRDCLEATQDVLGGKIYGPYQSKTVGGKPMYQWAAVNHTDSCRVWHTLYPLMSTRRKEQFDSAWERYWTQKDRRSDLLQISGKRKVS